MPRKTKIVNVADNVPVINETVEEPKVETVKEPKVELPPVLETKVEEPKVEEPKVEEPKVELQSIVEPKAKSEQTGTCELCGKTMLLKNLKYAHPKVCKKQTKTTSTSFASNTKYYSGKSCGDAKQSTI